MQIILVTSLKQDVGVDGLIQEKLIELDTSSSQMTASLRRREENTVNLTTRKRQKMEPLNEQALGRQIETLQMSILSPLVASLLLQLSTQSWNEISIAYSTSPYLLSYLKSNIEEISNLLQPQNQDQEIIDDDMEFTAPTEIPRQKPDLNTAQLTQNYESFLSSPPRQTLLQVYARLLSKTHSTNSDHKKLITKYAIQFPTLKPQLLEYICDDFCDRYEIGLMWLDHDSEGSEYFKAFYDRFELSDLEPFLLASTFIDIPFDREKWINSISTIKKLGLQRHSVRTICVDGLLILSSDEGKNKPCYSNKR